MLDHLRNQILGDSFWGQTISHVIPVELAAPVPFIYQFTLRGGDGEVGHFFRRNMIPTRCFARGVVANSDTEPELRSFPLAVRWVSY